MDTHRDTAGASAAAPSTHDDHTYDVVVVGAGVVGLTAALLIARRMTDARVAVVAPKPPAGAAAGDLRTAALFPDGEALLREAGVWPRVQETAAPLAGIRILDQSERLLRAPAVLFRASEVGHDHFGHNASNADMIRALEDAAARVEGLKRVEARVSATAVEGAWRTLTLDDGQTLRAKLVLAADGRRSALRAMCDISVREWERDQVAVTTHFSHTRGHDGISTELHTEEGPCTTVPFGDGRSSLVWMQSSASAEALLSDSNDGEAGPQFLAALKQRVGQFLGVPSDVRPPKVVPLLSLVANRLAGDRVMLVGESGHAFPPIGAQGLNLGMRDVASAVDGAVAALKAGGDPGETTVTEAYHRARWADVQVRSAGVDALNQSLISSMPFLPLARGAGMHLVRALPFAKRALMRQGMTGFSMPSLPRLAGR